MKKNSLLALVFLIGLFPACTKHRAQHAGKTPETVVKEFVELSASSKDVADRTRLSGFCTGQMRRALERMTDEAFRLAYLGNTIQIKEFEILSKAVVDGKATIRYKISIENSGGSQPTLEISEREVELVESRGAWYLENIRVQGSDEIAFTRGMIF